MTKMYKKDSHRKNVLKEKVGKKKNEADRGRVLRQKQTEEQLKRYTDALEDNSCAVRSALAAPAKSSSKGARRSKAAPLELGVFKKEVFFLKVGFPPEFSK